MPNHMPRCKGANQFQFLIFGVVQRTCGVMNKHVIFDAYCWVGPTFEAHLLGMFVGTTSLIATWIFVVLLLIRGMLRIHHRNILLCRQTSRHLVLYIVTTKTCSCPTICLGVKGHTNFSSSFLEHYNELVEWRANTWYLMLSVGLAPHVIFVGIIGVGGHQ